MRSLGATTYDVAIMGGGPAGSSLAARLARDTDLRVAIFETDRFPREHIGESLASPIIPCLQESGALPRVLQSQCYVVKAGGYYSWDPTAPTAAFFRHHLWERDGYHRWSLHVNRAEFDQILLDHARDCGVAVFQNQSVRRVISEDQQVQVHLADRNVATCRIFVDASGRMNGVGAGGKKAWLSSYRNVAIWGHFSGGKPAQSVTGEWNIFRERNLSPIGCFAFPDGWCWYIPVPQQVQGRRVLTHSLGIVTDPRVLKQPGKRYTEADCFLKAVRQIPLLRDLITDAQPLYRRLRTATNYSMISAEMCNFDEKWILVGDAAFFVDPLFSSGVSFALLQAAAAAEVIKASFDLGVAPNLKRELWRDYTELWRVTAHAFALTIDQWYAAIAHDNPDSIYWNERASNRTFETRMESFNWVLDTDFSGDLLHVVTKGTNKLSSLEQDGALLRTLRLLMEREPEANCAITLKPGVEITESLSVSPHVIEVCGPPVHEKPSAFTHGPYWQDPARYADDVQPQCPPPRRCFRFNIDRPDYPLSVRFSDLNEATDLYNRLRDERPTYGRLQQELTAAQWLLLHHLLLTDMLVIEESARSCV